MSDRQRQARERQFIIATAANPAPTTAVTSATATAPHIVLSPNCVDGQPCRGFSLLLFSPDSGGAATAGAGGFDVTVWRINPTLGIWGSLKMYTAPGAAYLDQLVCFDVGGGMGLYFQLGNVTVNGNVLVVVGELP